MTIYTTPSSFVDPTPSPARRVGEALGGGLSSGLAFLLEDKIRSMRNQKEKEGLIRKGFPPQIAEVWGELTEGGKTKFASLFMDELQRSPEVQDQIEIGEEETSGISRSPGLTPKESVARQDKRYDKNLPLFKEHEKKKTAQETENLKIDQLQRLNETNKLPQRLGRLNVNLKTGELLLPALANPESQLFVKTVNDFLIGAKETFGARVTNFEVNRFLKRLPTLANSKEGRRVILRQMEIINELNQLHNEGILNAFSQAGGIRNLDYDKASRQARKLTKEREKELKKEFNSILKNESPVQTPSSQIEETEVIMIDREGRRRAVNKKDVKAARKAGYKLSS